MLLGAHQLARQRRVGVYLAWWAVLYAAADGCFELLRGGSGSFGPARLLAGVLAVALVVVAALTAQRLLAKRAATIAMPPPMSPRRRLLWAVLFAAIGVIYGATLLSQGGPVPVIVIIGSMIGGMIGWLKTTSRAPADPAHALPLFALMLALFYVHVGEETLTNFSGMIATITGVDWNNHDFMQLITLSGPIVWFFAAWSLWMRQPLGNFVFWFLIVGMILGEPTHILVFPVIAMAKFGIGYEYFSGMYTSLFPMIPAILALVMIIRDHRQSKVAGPA
ncbi:hypothetical protein PSQ19_13545 [Devosia algicola]|uniref:Uncharacterized protein n=1 Tax=Devosia algicola TaxID=3026418 RepID=A0ABY7YKG8_9HYPH|nr:hypothetical protein [Devosia algicola]WDR01756.1 hypothetical protein PSQ19_13545 [Devosia algicola]